MKVFMIMWVVLCFLVIMGLLIAYATDQLPGVPAPQQVRLEAEDDCSPCEENLKRLKKAIEQQAVREREAKAAASAASDTK